jgi:hypothetical protein
LAMPSAQADAGDLIGTDLVCPNSVTGHIFVAGCLPSVNPPPGAVGYRGPDQLATLYGIPCTGSNTNTCIGLSRLQTAG